MSSNTNTSRYKQVNRQTRIQTREGAFSKGMMFTDKPLTEGYSKVLINYTVDPLDGTLRTRKGLQATGGYSAYGFGNSSQSFEMNKGFTNIVANTTRGLGRNFQNNTAQNSEVAMDLVTYNTATNALNVISLASITEEDRLTKQSNINHTKEYPFKVPYAFQPLCEGAKDPYQVLPHTILEPGVHGQKCIHDLYFKKPVGTFAFGNAYYTFSKHTLEDGTKTDELHYTQYYTEDTLPRDTTQVIRALHTTKPSYTATGDLHDHQVVPQKLNPSEAASAGYNMLAENPYAFECESGANISILGLIPYTNAESDTPLLSLTLNKDFVVKAFYRAPDSSTQYAAVVSYDSWANRNLANGYTLYEKYAIDANTGEITFQNKVEVSDVQIGRTYYCSTAHSNMFLAIYIKELNYSPSTYYSRAIEYTVQKGKQYHVVWDWREVGATQWNTIQDSFVTLNQQPLTCPFRAAVEQLILRVTISDPANITADSTGIVEYVESTTAIGLQFTQTNMLPKQNATPANYNLATAKGMLEWKSRLVLWGVENAETILFTSDVNNPAYFPYPNNIDILDEPVIHCMLYGDDLVVFTNTKLYRLTIGETGGIGAHTLIQKNLNILEKDTPMFCLVKNMLFFKSGNYYYMLVPKSTSIAGDTTIAPVSNTIHPFLDNFSVEVDKLFSIYTQGKTDPAFKQDVAWQYPLSSFLEYYYSYVDNESVVLNFVYDYSGFIEGAPAFDELGDTTKPPYRPELNSWESPNFTLENNAEYCRPKDKRQFILSLIYDTTTYAWRIQIYETPNVVHPIYYNAVGQQHYMYVTVKVDEEGQYTPLFVQCTKQGTTDNCIIYQNDVFNNLLDYTTIQESGIRSYKHHPLQQNYQYLDTGYRILTGAVDIKKRFREVQFSINNVSQKALTFYTAFIVDGNLRKDMRGYTTKMMVDPDDPRTGVLLVERPYIDERYLPSVPDYVIKVEDYVSPDVTPGDTTLDDTFVLDNTQFPDLAYWKVRVDVSGKGYVPRLQILSVNDKEYSLLSTDWVYRTMNSR